MLQMIIANDMDACGVILMIFNIFIVIIDILYYY